MSIKIFHIIHIVASFRQGDDDSSIIFLKTEREAFNPAYKLFPLHMVQCTTVPVYAIMLPFSVSYLLKVFLFKNMFLKKLLKV